MELLNKYKAFIKKENLFQAKDRLLLAVSGGVDSVVMVELCRQAGYVFVIAHCNFHLRGADSDRDEAFVRGLGVKYGVEVFVKEFDTIAIAKKEKKSIEETARDLRYGWFYELVASSKLVVGSWILTAHHADDNMETVMMNFFRGTGIKGLRGILPKQGKLVRPLLFARREEVEEFVVAHGLEYVTDHTNAENEYTRNYFRNEIIPLVSSKFSGVKENLLKNIQRFGEASILYNQAIEWHKKNLMEEKRNEVHIPVLKLKKSAPLGTIVYEIIKGYGFTAHQTEEVMGLLDSESGKYVRSVTHRIIKNRKWLIISSNEVLGDGVVVIEEVGSWKLVVGSLKLSTLPDTNYELPITNSVAALDASMVKFPLLLRKWAPGDYFYPLGMGRKKKKVSRFLIDNKLSMTEKEQIWVIESEKKIIWVVGMRIDERFKITDKTTMVLELRKSND